VLSAFEPPRPFVNDSFGIFHSAADKPGSVLFLSLIIFFSRLDLIERYRSASYEQLGGFCHALKKLLMVTVGLSLI
jgi:hypothetical protein